MNQKDVTGEAELLTVEHIVLRGDPPVFLRPRRRLATAGVALALAGLLLSGCANKTDSNSAGGGEMAQTTVATQPAAVTTKPAPAAPLQTTPQVEPSAQLYPGTGVFVHNAAQMPGGDNDAAPGDVTLNFVDADVREVLRSVLGDVLHLNYAIDPKVQATITVQTSRPLKRQDVLPALQQVLHASGLALINAAGIYRVVPAEDAARAGPVPVVVGRNAASLSSMPAYNVTVLPLKYASATELRRTLEPFVPKGTVLQADTARNLLIVSGAGRDLGTVADMVTTFDVDYMAGMSFAIVPLKTGSPKPVTDELNTIFGAGGSVPLGGVLRFAPLDRMNAVLVVSPQSTYLQQARAWIERLDRGADENAPRLYEYHVQNSRAADLAKVLTQLFSGQVSTVQPQTAPDTNMTQLGGSAMGASSLGGALGTGGLGSGGLGTGGLPGLSSGLGGQSNLSNASLTNATTANPSGTPGGAASSAQTAQGNDQSNSANGPGPGAPPLPPGMQLPPVRIVADEKNNTLVIYAKPRDYRMIEESLEKIDVVPLQVLIEATVAEVTLNHDLQFGLQWFLKKGGSSFGFSNTSPFQTTTTTTGTTTNTVTSTIANIPSVFPGFNYVFNAGGANVVLSALTAVTDVHVISAPQLLVLDHQVATLQVGDEVPIPTAQIQSTLAAGAPVVNTIQYLDTGVILRVSPRVNTNGLITLDITQEVSAPITTSSSSLNGPTIQQRRIQSSVTVQDGETIALGGLIQDTRTNTKNGIPILSDVPVVGALFRTTNNSDARTELLILLSPKVVHNAQEARDMTEELRRRIHGMAPAGSVSP